MYCFVKPPQRGKYWLTLAISGFTVTARKSTKKGFEGSDSVMKVYFTKSNQLSTATL